MKKEILLMKFLLSPTLVVFLFLDDNSTQSKESNLHCMMSILKLSLKLWKSNLALITEKRTTWIYTEISYIATKDNWEPKQNGNKTPEFTLQNEK